MAKSIACPKCKQPIIVSSQSIDADGRLACQSCGASFKIQKKPAEGQPAPPSKAIQPSSAKPTSSPNSLKATSPAKPLAAAQAPAPALPTSDADLWAGLPATDAMSDPFANQAPLNSGPLANSDPFAFANSLPFSSDPFAPQSVDQSQDPFSQSMAAYGAAQPLVQQPQNARTKITQQASSSQKNNIAKQTASTQKAATSSVSNGRKLLVPLIIGGILAATLLMVGVGVVIYFSTRPTTSLAVNNPAANNPAPNPANNANANANEAVQNQADDPRTGGLKLGMLAKPVKAVTVAEPIPGIEREPMSEYYAQQEEKKIKFLKHEAVVPAAVASKSFAELTAAVKPSVDESKAQAPRWTFDADPLPPEFDYELTENLKIVNELWNTSLDGANVGNQGMNDKNKPFEMFPDLKVYETSSYALMSKTYFANQNGPFAVTTPKLDKSPWGWKIFTKFPKITKYELIERPCENLQVIDLRTGQSSGEFSWEAPFWRPLVLSPDGQTLVGPSNDIEVTQFILSSVPRTEKETKELAKRQASLFAWKQGKKTKPVAMPMTGEVKAVKFANNTEMVVLVESPKRQLEVWDTSSGKRSKVIELDSKLTYPPNLSTSRYEKYDPLNLTMNPPVDHKALAISGGGKYASVLSESGAILVSLADSKVIGTLPLPGITKVPYVYSGSLQYVDAKEKDTEFDGKLQSCVGFEFLPTGNKLAITFSRDRLLRLMIYDITTGNLSLEKTWSSYDTSPTLAQVHPNGQGLILIDQAARLLAFDKPTFEEEALSKVLSFRPRGPMLTLSVDDKTFQRTYSTMPRNEFDDKLKKQLSVNFQKLPKRHAAQAIDRSKLEIVEPAPPATFQAVANWTRPTPPPATIIQTETSPLAFGGNKALLVNSRRNEQNFDAFDARIVDLSKPSLAENSKAFEILSYNFTEGTVSDRPKVGSYYFPGAMSSKDDKFAFGDPDKHGRAEIWSVDPPQRLMTFESSQKPSGYFSWMDFDGEGNLFTLEQGVLCSWKIAAEGVTGRFALAGDYCRPIHFSPDRKFLIASRGETFDLIDPATGKCLNRLTFNNKDLVSSFMFGPSGHHLAVHFGTNQPGYGFDDSKELGEHQSASHSVIWDLATGEALVSKFPIIIDGWFGPEHVVLRYVNGSIRGAGLFDLKYNMETVAYHTGAGSCLGDGRMWNWYGETKQYYLSSMSGTPTKEEAPYVDPQRVVFDIQKDPVSLEIVAGTPELAKKFAPELVTNMQKAGWKVGPSKFVIKVTPMAYDSNNKIEFTTGNVVDVPYVHYLWRLFDDKGQLIAEGATRGDFDQQTSKYLLNKNQLDLETRRVTGDTALGFRGKDPATAMIDEILESGRGLTYCGIPTYPQFLSGGKFYKIPTELSVSQSQ